MSINMMAPSDAANCTGELTKKWKSYRIAAIKNKTDTLDIPNKSLPLLSYNGLESKQKLGIISKTTKISNKVKLSQLF